jgi:hypothetical protein
MSEPQRARPTFSTDDFRLLRSAVARHIREIGEHPDSVKYANLYHRLGRTG